jgi:hypothetical protein
MGLTHNPSGGSALPLFDPVLDTLHRIIQIASVKVYLLEEGERFLGRTPEGDLGAFRNLDLKGFPGLPVHIRSVRLFALSAGTVGLTERHPNSYQRVVSLGGEGTIRVWGGNPTLPLPPKDAGSGRRSDPNRRLRRWKETTSVLHRLESDPKAPIHLRWSSVPPGLWHQPSAGPEEDWLTLAFHTADTQSLMDEYIQDHGSRTGGGPTLS